MSIILQMKYGEVHTGDAWIHARNRYCSNPQGPTMPVGLIVFGDKSHSDLHGTLSLTPIIFTLTLFYQTARNNTGFLEADWVHTKSVLWKRDSRPLKNK